jgi:glycerol-3-phosphate acyltransferase PlsY
MFKVLCIIIGYFIGCIQSAYCVGKLVGHIDIREHGSGNAGSTNVLRVLGVKAGALTFLGDILKSVVADYYSRRKTLQVLRFMLDLALY